MMTNLKKGFISSKFIIAAFYALMISYLNGGIFFCPNYKMEEFPIK